MGVIPEQSGVDEGVGATVGGVAGPIDRTGLFRNLSAGYEEGQAAGGSTRNRQNAAEAGYYDQVINALTAEGELGQDFVQSPVRKGSPFYRQMPGERVNPQGVVYVPTKRKFRNPYTGTPSLTQTDNPLARFYLGGDTSEKSAIWAAVQRVRQRKPGFLKDLPDEGALAARASKDRERRVAEAQEVTSRASKLGSVGSFVGNMVGSLVAGDPENFVGGGAGTVGKTFARTVIKRGLKEGAVNAVAGTVALPGIAADTERLGGELTPEDAVKSVAEQAALGFVLGVVPPLAGKVKMKAAAAVSTVSGKALDKVAAHLSGPVRDVVASAALRAGTVKDREALGEWRKLRSPYEARDTSTPDERAAAQIIDRDVEVQESSPFQPDAVPDHEARLAAMAKSLGVDLPPPRLPTSAPIQTPTVRDRSAGAESPRRGASYGEAVHSAEGTGKNPDSTADGHFQFTEGTWLEYAPKVTNTAGMSRAAILALRHDRDIATRAERMFRGDNARYLRDRGIEDSPGNLSLAHFLGRHDAARVLRSAPETPIANVVDARSIAANHNVFKTIKTARDMVAWGHRRIGAEVDAPVARGDSVAEYDPLDDADYEGIRPSGFEVLRPDEVQTDAGLMQYKSGGDEQGVTDTLKGVRSWNPILSQQILVWEAKDGRKIVVDGHQRVGLAKRLFPTDDTIRLPAVLLRETDGITARHARVLGALRNIINGTGTLMDNARVLRDAPSGSKMLPPNVPHAKESLGLSRLSYEAFGAAINDVIDPRIAAQIGLHAADLPDTHMALVALLLKEKITNPREAAAIVRQARADGFGTVNEQQLSLLGDLPVESLYVPIARILDASAKRLREDKRTFKTLAEKAGKIEGAGNVLARAANEERVISSDEALGILNATAYSSGPVRDALIAAARAELSGTRRADAVGQFLDALAGIDLRAAAAGLGSDGVPGRTLGEDGRGLASEATDSDVPGSDGPSLFEQALDGKARAEPFSDPVGRGSREQTDLLVHDLRAMLAAGEDTRGKGFILHGARGEVPDLTEGHYNPSNIYGGFETFYTTDAGDIAAGYQRKSKSGRIYQVSERTPVKFFDMEEALPVDELGRLFNNDDLAEMAIEEARKDGKASLREVMDEMRALSAGEGISRDEVQERFDGALVRLRESGFGGMTHVGGLRTGRDPHTVKIYFDAPNQLTLTDVTPVRPGASEPGPADIADVLAGQRGATLDNLIARASDNQRELATLGTALASEHGAEFKNPGVKETDRIRAKIENEGYGDVDELKDLARAAFVIERPEQADALVAAVSSRFPVYDKGWVELDSGYFDRKLIVRFPNGGVGEIQIVPRGLWEAKTSGGVGKLYRRQRASSDVTEVKELERLQREAYAAALDGTAFTSLRSSPRSASGNADVNSASLSERPSADALPIRAGAERQIPLDQAQAEPSPAVDQTLATGRSSTSNRSMFNEDSSTADIGEEGRNVNETASALDLGAASDPELARRQGQQVELKVEAPLQSVAEQEGTMGLGLFDVVDQPTFRLDEEGDPRSLKDILDEAEADDAAAKNAKDCLK